ncbi:hypothetical protein L1987_14870 [Smallanthus sonchifolius]|uniref:Uncharacterized protein n=1 Tax=Smallanthus sonchifolius TaxID=185202 RepID=A0ACB9J6K0_9ASTR|nr:hypothetical protein L1987_14870 [Smallanthus sonchifolius]
MKDIRRACEAWGSVESVYIARKLSKSGKRFTFVNVEDGISGGSRSFAVVLTGKKVTREVKTLKKLALVDAIQLLIFTRWFGWKSKAFLYVRGLRQALRRL